MRDALRIGGYAGTVLFLFGLLSFAFSGRFDLWTGVHVVAGGLLVAAALAANVAGVRRTVAARGTRERATAFAGTAVFGALLVVVNLLAARFPKSWDATESKIYTLGERTLAVVGHLDRPVELIAFFEPADRSKGALEDLLARYARASRNVTYRFVDPEREPQLVDQLRVTRAGVLAARCGTEIAQSPGGASGGFGEGEVTSLILKVSRAGGKRIYAITGHGESEPGDLETPAGLGGLAAALHDDNIELSPLLLATAPAIPADAAAVLLAGPRKPLLPHELDQLRAYLARGGRLVAMIDPGNDGGIGPLLADYRLQLRDDVIVDQEEIAFLGARLGLDPIIEDFPPHPITRGFKQRILLSQARSLSIATEGGVAGVVAQPLARTRETAWGEGRWKEMLATGRVGKDPDDAPGPLLVAATATVPIAGDGGTPAPEGTREARLILFGDADWVANGNLAAFFNRELAMNALHWVMGSEDLIVGPAKTLRASRLDMTTADQRNLFRFGVLFLPEALLIGGLAAWLLRKSL